MALIQTNNGNILTTGSLVFATSQSNNLKVDGTSILFLTASKAGVNNIAPAYTLDVGGDSNLTGNIRVNGNILVDNSRNITATSIITTGNISSSGAIIASSFTGSFNATNVVGGAVTASGVFTSGNVTIGGNLTLLGSGSIINISSSVIDIGANKILLNAYSPFQRYAGISAQDSGSSNNLTSSMYWDSLNNYWLLQGDSGNAGAIQSSSIIIGGPISQLGAETLLTSNFIPKALTGVNIGNSLLSDNGTQLNYTGISGFTTTTISSSNQAVSGNITAGSITSPTISGVTSITATSITASLSGSVTGIFSGSAVGTFSGSSVQTGNVTINGGSINNTTIGLTTSVAGTFTTLSASNEYVSGNIYAAGGISGSGILTFGTISGSSNLVTNLFTASNSRILGNEVVVGNITAGSLNATSITGSFSGSIVGTILGTSSYATNALTASYSNASTSASYALSASYGYFSTSASYINASGITNGTLLNSVLPSQINVVGISASFTGSLAGSASYANNATNALTASYALTVSSSAIVGIVVSASYANTASYSLNAKSSISSSYLSASFATVNVLTVTTQSNFLVSNTSGSGTASVVIVNGSLNYPAVLTLFGDGGILTNYGYTSEFQVSGLTSTTPGTVFIGSGNQITLNPDGTSVFASNMGVTGSVATPQLISPSITSTAGGSGNLLVQPTPNTGVSYLPELRLYGGDINSIFGTNVRIRGGQGTSPLVGGNVIIDGGVGSTINGNILLGTNNGAYVGIGVLVPTNSLDVKGNISCSVITASLFYGTASISNSGSVTATSTNATYYLGLSSATSGSQPTYVATGLTYNPSTNTLGTTIISASTHYGTSSWSNNSITASYINASNITNGTLTNAVLPSQINVTGVTASFLGTASWANNAVNAISASFSSTSSYSLGSANAFLNNGNSFAGLATLGTNDGNSLNIRTNSATRLVIDTNAGITASAVIAPSADNTYTLGTYAVRFKDFFSVQSTIGALFETGLTTIGISVLETGTVLTWRSGKLIPSDEEFDEMVMGVVQNGKDEPIVFGAEPVLVTGIVNEGDYIVTSNKVGHGMGIPRNSVSPSELFGKVIAQAVESGSGDSYVIKAMIRKM